MFEARIERLSAKKFKVLAREDVEFIHEATNWRFSVCKVASVYLVDADGKNLKICY